MMHPIPVGQMLNHLLPTTTPWLLDRYLRIAPELYLKRLIVGGMEPIFEINRNFRNEGVDATHNPEFTSIEFYWAYRRYTELMDLTEELFEYLFDRLGLDRKIEYGDLEIDFSTSFKRVSWIDSIVEIGGVPKDIATDKEKALEFLKSKNIEVDESLSLGYLPRQSYLMSLWRLNL